MAHFTFTSDHYACSARAWWTWRTPYSSESFTWVAGFPPWAKHRWRATAVTLRDHTSSDVYDVEAECVHCHIPDTATFTRMAELLTAGIEIPKRLGKGAGVPAVPRRSAPRLAWRAATWPLRLAWRVATAPFRWYWSVIPDDDETQMWAIALPLVIAMIVSAVGWGVYSTNHDCNTQVTSGLIEVVETIGRYDDGDGLENVTVVRFHDGRAFEVRLRDDGFPPQAGRAGWICKLGHYHDAAASR